ncbi:hypothetical protein HY642_07040 [Candidatus Woesearchaeota archaeon]|nr:hypothetical protein [Candidatus Woesearchaeota archaeon]
MLYYCYDVGSDIHLDGIATILGQKPETSSIKVERLAHKYVEYAKAPLLVRLGAVSIALGASKSVEAEAEAKLYDFGVIAIRFWMPFSGTFEELRKLAQAVVEREAVANAAKAKLEAIKAEIKHCIMNPQYDHDWEDYAVFSVQKLSKPVDSDVLMKLHGKDIARVLRSEAGELSTHELENAVKNPLSYFRNDLVLVDWSAAFIYDPRAKYDVPDVLEFAAIQLLELRAYDAILDETLDEAYETIEQRQKHFWWRLSPYGVVLRKLLRVKLDVTEVVDKVDNSLKLIGDLFLARVYAAAEKRFGMEQWERSVKEKLETIGGTYEMLSSQMEARRMVVLELIIVVLFVIDLVLLALLEI